MKFVIAIDSFKGSLSTFEAGEAIKEGALAVIPTAKVKICPLADGGEGTAYAIVSATEGEMISAEVTGPLGDKVTAQYGMISSTHTAVIEMASAAGITLVPDEKCDPLYTTTFGVGELILKAIREHGCRRFIIGIGGSATNDGGTGMLSALGFEFLKSDGTPITPFGIGLSELAEIRTDKAIPELSECDFKIACDVKNPLTGENGCSRIYGPQKGATEKTIKDMDAWLENYAALTKTIFPHSDKNYSGAGAAGGMGFAFLSYLGGKLVKGIDLVIDQIGLDEQIRDADLVITGEGRLDGQTCMGKAPIGVAECAKKYGKPVIAFAGAVTPDARLTNSHGIDAFFPILRAPCTLSEAMDKENAYRNLRDTAEQVIRLWAMGKE